MAEVLNVPELCCTRSQANEAPLEGIALKYLWRRYTGMELRRGKVS